MIPRLTYWNLPVLEVLSYRMVDHHLVDGPKLLCRIIVDEPHVGPTAETAFADQLRVVAG